MVLTYKPPIRRGFLFFKTGQFRTALHLEPSPKLHLEDCCEPLIGVRRCSCDTEREVSPRETVKGTECLLIPTLLGSALDEAAARQVELVHRGLTSRRPIGRRCAGVKRGPTPEQVVTLWEVVDPEGESSPFFDASLRVRNALMLDLLFYLGIRGGELLSLCTTDIDWDRCQIVIARRPDERTDPRQRQPLVKTLDRRIPLL